MVTRRDFLKLAGLGTGAALITGCAPQLWPLTGEAGVSGVSRLLAASTPPATPTIMPQASALPVAASTLPVPTPKYKGRNLCFVLWDHQLARYAYRPRNMQHPVPETVPLYSGSSMRMTEAWTDYWKGILRLTNPGMSYTDFERNFASLVANDRAFTNGTGPEDDPNHWAIHSITCGGATHEMVTGIHEKHGVRIYTLNWRNGPPPIPETTDEIDMTRHFFATTGTNIKLPDGSYAVYGFPQFENCIIPLLSMDDTDFIDASRIKPVSDIQPPYNTWAGQARKVGGGRR